MAMMFESINEKKLRALLKKSLDTIKSLNNKNTSAKDDPVAIIGMSCRLPGAANTPEAFWRLLQDKVEVVSQFPKSEALRTAFENYFEGQDSCYTSNASYLEEDSTAFDARFFNLSPKEVKNMDPQQRLALELVWEAVERAGYNPLALPSSTGVFVGVIGSEYGSLEKKQQTMGPYTATGSLASITSGRISHFFNINGPSLSIDTACSSSLSALHLAVQALKSGDCDLAIAGGINLFADPATFNMLCQIQALSPDGKCKTFSEHADGYGRGEGGGFVVLKLSKAAKSDGDLILSSLLSTVVNHDGHSSGLTVPNGKAQQNLLLKGLNQANLSPSDMDFIELHGTGTPLGDPIEVQAIQQVYTGRTSDEPLLLSGLKSNIGHLEAAAGIVGVIKSTLCLMNKSVPPQVLAGNINPRIGLNGKFEIPLKQKSLSADKKNHYAAVSSFGFSGCNTHVILRGEENTYPVAEKESLPQLVCISARTETALETLLQRYADHLESVAPNLANLAYTANKGRTHFNYRIPFLISSKTDFQAQLNHCLKERKVSIRPVDPNSGKKLVFFIDGFISLSAGTQKIRDLYIGYSSFRAAITEIDEWCVQLNYPSFKAQLFEAAELRDFSSYPLAIFTYQVALAKLLMELTGSPDFFVGSGLGQIAVAYLTASLSLEDAIVFVNSQHPGFDPRKISFCSQGETNGELIATFPDQNCFSYLNENQQDTVSVVFEALHYVPIEKTTVTDQFLEQINPPEYAVLSGQTGSILTMKMLRQDWLSMLTTPTHMESCLATLTEQGGALILGISLAGNVYDTLRNQIFTDQYTYVPAINVAEQDPHLLPHLLALLYTEGREINWTAFYNNSTHPYSRILLPTYPFERNVYCSNFSEQNSNGNSPSADKIFQHKNPFLPTLLSLPIHNRIVAFSMSQENLPLVADTHGILHIGFYHEMLLAASAEAFKKTAFKIDHISFLEPLLLSREEMQVHIVFEELEKNKASFRVNARQTGSWVCYAEGLVSFDHEVKTVIPQKTSGVWESEMSGRDFYAKMGEKGIQLGASVSWINQLNAMGDELECQFRMPEKQLLSGYSFPFDVTALDACAQVFNFWGLERITTEFAFMVESMQDISFYADPNPVPAKCTAVFKKYDAEENTLEGALMLFNDNHELLYKAGLVRMKGVKKSYWAQLKKIMGQQPDIERTLSEEVDEAYVILYLKEVLCKLLDLTDNDIHINSMLSLLGCDSLMNLQLKRSVDVHFQIDFPLNQLLPESRISSIAHEIYLKKYGGSQPVSTAAETPGNWLRIFPGKKDPALRLYCFAYGAGSAALFSGWQQLLPSHIEVCGIQLPGHEDRYGEPFANDIEELTGALAAAIAKEDRIPFAFYGHSAGALFAYAVATALSEELKENLVHFFCGGFSAPVLWPNPWYLSSRQELIALGYPDGLQSVPNPEEMEAGVLRRLSQVLRLPYVFEGNEPLIRLSLKLLVADMKIMGSFKGGDQLVPLDCPLTAFWGQEDDRVSRTETQEWAQLTSQDFEFIEMKGDHFFMNPGQQEHELTQYIATEMNAILNLK